MPNWRDKDWSGGARARLFHSDSAVPGESFEGFFVHRHTAGDGWSNQADLSGAPPPVFYFSGQGGTWTVKGHKSPVRIEFTRNGVPDSEDLTLSNGYSRTISAGVDENVIITAIKAL